MRLKLHGMLTNYFAIRTISIKNSPVGLKVSTNRGQECGRLCRISGVAAANVTEVALLAEQRCGDHEWHRRQSSGREDRAFQRGAYSEWEERADAGTVSIPVASAPATHAVAIRDVFFTTFSYQRVQLLVVTKLHCLLNIDALSDVAVRDNRATPAAGPWSGVPLKSGTRLKSGSVELTRASPIAWLEPLGAKSWADAGATASPVARAPATHAAANRDVFFTAFSSTIAGPGQSSRGCHRGGTAC